MTTLAAIMARHVALPLVNSVLIIFGWFALLSVALGDPLAVPTVITGFVLSIILVFGAIWLDDLGGRQ